ncbi:MAG: hypothetical protein COV36_01630 [Alphaproteobacteria bacterium CG11_big_fil_rev_8_21_14_0_20_44_7]|nr:MAG: hypothetical protein COV36_01630 [Alphaproteobacteria bacterium CG11_big_fil_rev_8_21_14_0_20_44_7]
MGPSRNFKIEDIEAEHKKAFPRSDISWVEKAKLPAAIAAAVIPAVMMISALVKEKPRDDHWDDKTELVESGISASRFIMRNMEVPLEKGQKLRISLRSAEGITTLLSGFSSNPEEREINDALENQLPVMETFFARGVVENHEAEVTIDSNTRKHWVRKLEKHQAELESVYDFLYLLEQDGGKLVFELSDLDGFFPPNLKSELSGAELRELVYEHMPKGGRASSAR